MKWLVQVLVSGVAVFRVAAFGIALCVVLVACTGGSTTAESTGPDSTAPDSPTTVPDESSTTSESTTSSAPTSTETTVAVELILRSDATGLISALVPEAWQITNDGPNSAGGISWQLRSNPAEPGPSLWAIAGALDQLESDIVDFAEFSTTINTCDSDVRIESQVTVGTTPSTRIDYPTCRDGRLGTILVIGDNSSPLAMVAVITDSTESIHEEVVASISLDPEGEAVESTDDSDVAAQTGLIRVEDDSGRLIIELPDDWSYDTSAGSSGLPFIGASKAAPDPNVSLLESPLLQLGVAPANGMTYEDTPDLVDTLLDDFGVSRLDCDSFSATPWAVEGSVGSRITAISCGPQRVDVSAYVGTALSNRDVIFLIVSTEAGADWTAESALDLLEVR